MIVYKLETYTVPDCNSLEKARLELDRDLAHTRVLIDSEVFTTQEQLRNRAQELVDMQDIPF